MEKVLWFFIFLILGCAIVWIVGSFIAWDMLWFIHGWVGRLIAAIFFIGIVSGAAKEADEM
jgi:hypothetical protein